MGLCLNKPQLAKLQPKVSESFHPPIPPINSMKQFKSIISDKRLTVVLFHQNRLDIQNLLVLVKEENEVSFYTCDMTNKKLNEKFHALRCVLQTGLTPTTACRRIFSLQPPGDPLATPAFTGTADEFQLRKPPAKSRCCQVHFDSKI